MFKNSLIKLTIVATTSVFCANTARAQCEDLIIARSKVIAGMASQDNTEHGFFVYIHENECTTSKIFSSKSHDEVVFSFRWNEKDKMIAIVHTHPQTVKNGRFRLSTQYNSEQYLLSEVDTDMVITLKEKLHASKIQAGIVTKYGTNRDTLYLYDGKNFKLISKTTI